MNRVVFDPSEALDDAGFIGDKAALLVEHVLRVLVPRFDNQCVSLPMTPGIAVPHGNGADVRPPVQGNDPVGVSRQLLADHDEMGRILDELKAARHVHGAGRASAHAASAANPAIVHESEC